MTATRNSKSLRYDIVEFDQRLGRCGHVEGFETVYDVYRKFLTIVVECRVCKGMGRAMTRREGGR